MRSPSTLLGWREGKKPQWTTSQPPYVKSPTSGPSELRCGGGNGFSAGSCSEPARPQPVPAVQRTCSRLPSTQAQPDPGARQQKSPRTQARSAAELEPPKLCGRSRSTWKNLHTEAKAWKPASAFAITRAEKAMQGKPSGRSDLIRNSHRKGEIPAQSLSPD